MASLNNCVVSPRKRVVSYNNIHDFQKQTCSSAFSLQLDSVHHACFPGNFTEFPDHPRIPERSIKGSYLIFLRTSFFSVQEKNLHHPVDGKKVSCFLKLTPALEDEFIPSRKRLNNWQSSEISIRCKNTIFRKISSEKIH